jgi:hypothetical protein
LLAIEVTGHTFADAIARGCEKVLEKKPALPLSLQISGVSLHPLFAGLAKKQSNRYRSVDTALSQTASAP